MTDLPSYLLSRDKLASYLCALCPPSPTTLEEQLDLLEADIARAVEFERLQAAIDALGWSVVHEEECEPGYPCRVCEWRRQLALYRDGLGSGPVDRHYLKSPAKHDSPPHARDEAERAADAATPTEE